MTFVRATTRLESDNLEKDETNTLMNLISSRDESVTGGFYDSWDSSGSGGGYDNRNNTPFKLHYYRLRIFTTKPCIIYSSTVKNYSLARQAPGGINTGFTQENIANGTVKKWQTTVDGGYWSKLSHEWTKRVWSKKHNRMITVGDPKYMNNEIFKLQVMNIDPASLSSHFASVIEMGIEYDQSSTA